MRLDEVKKSDCERYLNARRSDVNANPMRRSPSRLAEGTIQRERSFLGALFQQAVEDGLIDRNPWRGVERKPYAVRDRVVTESEQAELLTRLSPRFQRFVLFLLGTGVRLEECRTINPGTKAGNWRDGDLRLDDRWLKVTGKFRKKRVVPLQLLIVSVIEEQLETEGCLWRQNPQRLREVLAEACRERPAVMGRISRRGRMIAARAGRVKLELISPHTLRHTFGWRWLRSEGDIYSLSKVLGHASVAVTEKHYAKLLAEDLRLKADRVDLGLDLPLKTARVLGWKR
jgi:integrase